MRALSSSFVAAASGGATTLARCWKLTRRDGVVLGFTDHDRDLTFDGVTFAARTGAQASETESHFDFAVGGGEVAGALSSDGLSEIDLAKGLWDKARIEVFAVDWTNPAARLLLDEGVVGEVRRQDSAYVTEMRALAHQLDEERGRLFAARCPAALGDSRCRVDLAGWRVTGTVSATDGQSYLRAAALTSFASGVFRAGSLKWTSGANANLTQDVRDHSQGEGSLLLWSAPPRPIAIGDAFIATAGCDKQFSTCRDRFGNAVNFRGFPHIPGNDVLMRVARDGEPNMDGGSLFQ
ncbi:DUF2163 domain-containing protein [Terrarubrum flagellatum]|uniref:DUF2163 domain-containing protein n=1 Tax=Terrirubrum flagellatum TaxID=2895980 RepID=UPI00314561B1